MTWTNAAFVFGGTVSSAEVTNLSNNIAAFGANDSGSPVMLGRVISTKESTVDSELNITGNTGTTTLITLGSMSVEIGQQIAIFGSVTAYIDGFDGETFTTMNLEITHNGNVVDTIDIEPIFTKMRSQGEQTITVGYSASTKAVFVGDLILRLTHSVSSMTIPNLLIYNRSVMAMLFQDAQPVETIFGFSQSNGDDELITLGDGNTEADFSAPGAAGATIIGNTDLRAYTNKLHLEFDVYDIEASTDMDGNSDGVGLISKASMSDYQSTEPFSDESLSGDVSIRNNRLGFSNARLEIFLPGLTSVAGNESPVFGYDSPHVYMVTVDFVAHKIWFGRDGVYYGGGDPAAGTDPWLAADGSGVGSATTWDDELFDDIELYACVHFSISSGGGGYSTRLRGGDSYPDLYLPEGYNEPT